MLALEGCVKLSFISSSWRRFEKTGWTNTHGSCTSVTKKTLKIRILRDSRNQDVIFLENYPVSMLSVSQNLPSLSFHLSLQGMSCASWLTDFSGYTNQISSIAGTKCSFSKTL